MDVALRGEAGTEEMSGAIAAVVSLPSSTFLWCTITLCGDYGMRWNAEVVPEVQDGYKKRRDGGGGREGRR